MSRDALSIVRTRRRLACELGRVLTIALALTVALDTVAFAQAPAPAAPAPAAPAPPTFKAEELEQIVAPIALYPDPLLAQIFMASTYPLEVVQAARFAKSNTGLTGDKLNEALKNQTWDDSVKSLVSVPQVLTMMNDQLDWMQKLGDAFLGQEADVMAAVQRLRAKAQTSGNLKSNAQQTVTSEPAPAPPAAPAAPPSQTVVVQQPPPTIIKVEPTDPQVVYVPSYTPAVVYGGWPYPAYPPYAYYPPGYVAGAAITFGVGMAVGAAMWGNCNWGGGDVNVNVNKQNSFSNSVNHRDAAQQRTQRTQQGGNKWQHNPQHRQGVQYRDTASQQKFGKGTDSQRAQARESHRGREGGGGPGAGGGQAGRGDAGGARGGGPGSAGASQMGRGGDAGGARGDGPGASQAGRGGDAGGGAFDGVGQGRTNQSSARGQQSMNSARSSGGGGAGGAGGGGRGGGGGGRGGGGRGRR